MKIQLGKSENLRIINESHDEIKDPFVNIYSVESSSDYHLTRGLSVAVFEMHQVFLIKKERIYRLFSFGPDDSVYIDDFGYWADGEIVFTNSEIEEV